MKKRVVPFLFLAFLLFGCNNYQKITKSNDLDMKYEVAKKYYNKGDFGKAMPLFEELIRVYKGTKSVEEIYFFYANCEYGQGNYLLSSYHFKNFYSSYPNGEYAEESLYMYAYSYFMLSPRIELEQTYTLKALDAFQLFVNSYPNSHRMEQCNNLMDELHKKLEKKDYLAAELYWKTGNFKAAAVSFENFLRKYPDTEYAEKARFLIVKSWYEYANLSIESKKMERYQLAAGSYQSFVDKYSRSRYLKEAEQIFDASLKAINTLSNKKTTKSDSNESNQESDY